MQRVTNAIRRSAVVVTIVGLAALGLGQVAQAATTDPTVPDGKDQSAPAGTVDRLDAVSKPTTRDQ